MTELPKNLTILPEMELGIPASADLLSHVLAQIRLTGDRVYSCSLAQAGCLELEAGAAHVCLVMAGALSIEGGERGPLIIDTGDLVMLPHGAGALRLAAEGTAATMLLCRFRFETDSLRGMVSALPDCIHIRRAEGAGWLEGIVHFLMIEAGDIQPGAALMVSRLIDLVVIRTLRSWVHQGPASGWLGGLADVRIASALKAIHERPTERRSLDTLAGIAGMSRSNFCERFTALVGRPPLRYQNEWRLTLARDLLAKGGARVSEIGFIVGYESEAAFSRAYKALFGHSPRAEFKPRGVSLHTV
jgi:AraC-like DNA-binding protein